MEDESLAGGAPGVGPSAGPPARAWFGLSSEFVEHREQILLDALEAMGSDATTLK